MVTDDMVEKACRANIHPDSDPSDTERRKMRAALEAALSAAEPVSFEGQNYNCPCVHPSQCDESCLKPAPSVAVKALEWEEGPAGSYMEVCESILGTYRVWEINGMSCVSLGGGPGRTCGSTLYDAKAAAQSDYEVRIRSALTAQVQDVATAAEFADRMFNLHGFMLCERHNGKHAVTVTFPNLSEAQQFHGALVDLSRHRTDAAPAKQEGQP